MLAFTADNFTIDTFCHAVHREEREEARLEAMKPLRTRRENIHAMAQAAMERKRVGVSEDYRNAPFLECKLR